MTDKQKTINMLTVIGYNTKHGAGFPIMYSYFYFAERGITNWHYFIDRFLENKWIKPVKIENSSLTFPDVYQITPLGEDYLKQNKTTWGALVYFLLYQKESSNLWRLLGLLWLVIGFILGYYLHPCC